MKTAKPSTAFTSSFEPPHLQYQRRHNRWRRQPQQPHTNRVTGGDNSNNKMLLPIIPENTSMRFEQTSSPAPTEAVGNENSNHNTPALKTLLRRIERKQDIKGSVSKDEGQPSSFDHQQEEQSKNVKDEPPVDWINQSRRQVGLQTLRRSYDLDVLAEVHAINMATKASSSATTTTEGGGGGESDVFHAVTNIQALQRMLRSDKVGSNVQKCNTVTIRKKSSSSEECEEVPYLAGTIAVLHDDTMKHHTANRSNVLSNKFREYGMGVAYSDDGSTLYCCQYFRGPSST